MGPGCECRDCAPHLLRTCFYTRRKPGPAEKEREMVGSGSQSGWRRNQSCGMDGRQRLFTPCQPRKKEREKKRWMCVQPASVLTGLVPYFPHILRDICSLNYFSGFYSINANALLSYALGLERSCKRVPLNYTKDWPGWGTGCCSFDRWSIGALWQDNDPYKVHLRSCISFLLPDGALQKRLWNSWSHWGPSQPGSEVFMGPELEPPRQSTHQHAVSKLFSPLQHFLMKLCM